MTIPNLMAVPTDGSCETDAPADRQVQEERQHLVLLDAPAGPVPDGKTVALVSDGPDPTKSNVVLQF